MAQRKQDIWDRAIEAFEQGAHSVLEHYSHLYLAADPDNFPARMLHAHGLLKMKRFGEAAEVLESANPQDEREVVLWHRTAGDYYAERGDYEAAEDEYASALALIDRQTSDLVLDLVDAMINQGNNEGAVAAVEAFASRKDDDREDHELLAHAQAKALRNLGRFEEALTMARRALELCEVDFPAAEDLVEELEARVTLEQEPELGEGDEARPEG